MNDSTHFRPFDPLDEDACDSEARAFARVVGRDDDLADWDHLCAAAVVDPTVWERLAQALHDDARLRRAFGGQVAAAEAVALPPLGPAASPRLARAVGRWAVAAAVLALAAWWCAPRPGAMHDDAAPPSAEVVEELPRVVLESRCLPDGRAEVVYLRRSVERATVRSLIGLGFDEYGEPRPTVVDAALLQSPRRY